MIIQYKTKVKKFSDGRKYIDYKKTIEKKDFVGKPHEHNLYNSDLFKNCMNRCYKAIIGEYKRWEFIDSLPHGVSIDTSGFLAIVTINAPDRA